MWIPNQQLKLKMRVKKEKTFRIKTNNQELLIRKQNESDATSWWIEFQKTSLQWKAYRIQDWFLDLLDDFKLNWQRNQIQFLFSSQQDLETSFLVSSLFTSKFYFKFILKRPLKTSVEFVIRDSIEISAGMKVRDGYCVVQH